MPRTQRHDKPETQQVRCEEADEKTEPVNSFGEDELNDSSHRVKRTTDANGLRAFHVLRRQGQRRRQIAGGFCRHLDWTLAVGALNLFAGFTIVNGDGLGAPRTGKVDSHPEYSITLRRAP